MTRRILCVDDDANVLQAYQRALRKQFEIHVAASGAEGLEQIERQGPYAVIVSDMRMPGMDGVRFLAAVRERAGESVRMMLTGQADLQTAMEAVNEGHIFRFLAKPCPPEVLAKALTAGLEQYRLIVSERELLENTLRGSIKVLTEVLALVNPAAFGRAARVRQIVSRLAAAMGIGNPWQLDVAAMLSQIGCVTLPADTVERLYHGRRLSDEEALMVRGHPGVGRDLVANIPRLEEVAEIIAFQDRPFQVDADGACPVPLGARVLKVALDFDTLCSSGLTELEAALRMRQTCGLYDPQVLEALAAIANVEETCEIRLVGLHELVSGMVLADDVRTIGDVLLVCKGQEVSASLSQRLRNYARRVEIREPIRVIMPAQPPAALPNLQPFAHQETRA